MIVVLSPGAATTVEDLGRSGWRSSGVPSGGAMDPWAARAVNRLVGNPDGAALLELTLAGPRLRFERRARVAWLGGGLEAAIDGAPARADRSHDLPAGATLELGRTRSGARAWLAIAGGIDVAEVLGSRSTELAGAFGGLSGRRLAAGDRLPVHALDLSLPPRRLRDGYSAGLAARTLRILAGPDGDASEEALCREAWTAGSRSDRRGVRFEPAAGRVRPAAAGERRSQGTLPGAVQAPASGEAIVLGPDAPVTGGYPWVAQVVAADLGRLAHYAPGARVRFEPATFTAAEAWLAGRERELAEGIVE